MNPRIQFGESPGRFRFATDGTLFPFQPGNPADRLRALAALSAHGERVIAALDVNVGRTLTDRELLHGLEPVEDRPLRQQIADSTAETTKRPYFDSNESNPFARALEMGLGDSDRPESKTARYKRLADKWDDDKAAEAAAAEVAANPQTQKAIAHAQQELYALKYNPDVTRTEIRAAEQRLNLAKAGDLVAYSHQDREFQATKAARLDAKVSEVDAQIAALKAKRDGIVPFEPPTPPAEPSTPQPMEPIPVMSQEDYVAGVTRTRAVDAARKAAVAKELFPSS